LLVEPDQRTTIMAWTTEGRCRYAPAIQETMRRGMLVRLAATIDAIDPPAPVGRPRVWPTLPMLLALRHVARDDRAWPAVGRSWIGRSERWSPAAVSRPPGRKRRPTAAIIDTQSEKAGPQRGPRGYE
jgi:hypothetical protein